MRSVSAGNRKNSTSGSGEQADWSRTPILPACKICRPQFLEAWAERPDKRQVFDFGNLVEVVQRQRRYVKASFEETETISGTQDVSCLPESERKRIFTAIGFSQLTMTVGRDAVSLKAYGQQFSFTEEGLVEAKARSVRERELTRKRQGGHLGRPKKHDDAICEIVRDNPCQTARDVAEKVGCGTTTVASALARNGLSLEVPTPTCIDCGGDISNGTAISKWCCECKAEKGRVLAREYQRKHRKTLKRKEREKWGNDPRWKLRRRISDYVRRSVQYGGGKKNLKALEYIGCTTEELMRHIESQFKEGMTWDNRDAWHIDHIYPVSKADMLDEFQLFGAFNWRNMQPLWAGDNASKQASVTPEAFLEFMRLCKLVAKERKASCRAAARDAC